MTAPRTCKHCNGTTYCGGSISATSGKLRTRPACPTCLVKSKLDPASIYERVVCSVCQGTGLVQPAAETSLPRRTSPLGIVAAIGIVTAASAFFSISLIFYIRAQSTPEEIKGTLRKRSQETAHESVDSIKKRVGPGRSKDFVEETLGSPTSREEINSGPNLTELWEYECADGHVRISMLNGIVQSVREY